MPFRLLLLLHGIAGVATAVAFRLEERRCGLCVDDAHGVDCLHTFSSSARQRVVRFFLWDFIGAGGVVSIFYPCSTRWIFSVIAVLIGGWKFVFFSVVLGVFLFYTDATLFELRDAEKDEKLCRGI